VALTATSIVFVSALVFGDTPFNVLQLLWINMIMDTLAAFSLATEAPQKQLAKQEAVSPSDLIISAPMWRNILV